MNTDAIKNNVKIIVAKPTGLCFGVRRAIAAIEKELATGGALYAIGSPIHNPQEVARLESMGLKIVSDENEVPDGATAFIRAHGAPPSVFDALKQKNCVILDGTCPFVQQVQKKARELSEAGYHLLLLGNEKHPEVRGILGYVSGKYTVISGEMAKNSTLFCSTISKNSDRIPKLGLVSQTTQEPQLLAEVARAAVSLADEFRVYNTICRATIGRQAAARKLAAEVDGMIVIGGYDSANTEKLFHIASAPRCSTLWIESAKQLDKKWLSEKRVIGIAAGASTPDWLIEQLFDAINTVAGRQGDVSYE